MSIAGNLVGSYSQIGKTFIIEDSDGNEIAGVVVDQETVFTATDNDVREGYVYAGDHGVSIGTKIIPNYHTTMGTNTIAPGEAFAIHDENYDYDFMQVVICSYRTSLADSVEATMIVIDDYVYMVGSTEPVARIEKDHENKQINLNIINNTGNSQIIRYMLVKEIL